MQHTKLLGEASIVGVVIIGKNCKLGPDVFFGPYAVGDGCVLKKVEVQSMIMMNNTRVKGGQRTIDILTGSYSAIVTAALTHEKGTLISEEHKLV